MDEQLTFNAVREIESKMRAGSFTQEVEIRDLVIQGLSEERASEIISKMVKDYKLELFNKINDDKKLEERGKFATAIAITFSLLIAFFGKQDSFLLFVTIAVACICGFYGFPKKPFAAVFGFAIGAILMPIASKLYFQNRTSFMKLELFIPILASFGPGLFIKYLISKFMYDDDNENQ